MFTSVYRGYRIAAVCCAVYTALILPLSARAQESAAQAIDAADFVASEAVAIDSPDSQIVEVGSSYVGSYPVESLFAEEGDIPGDFVVGPGKIDVVIKPGESKTVEMIVSNRTGERRRFNMSMEDAAGSSDAQSSVVLLGSDRGPYSMKDYISVPHKSFELNHNERARIPVTISIPADAEPGGLYGSVLVDTVAIEAVAGDTGGTVPQSAIIARIGTLFFITVPGDVETAGTLKNFGTVPEQTFFQKSPIQFGVLFENTGSIHLLPYGELRISNMFDEEVGFVKLDPWFVLPESVRLREVSWNRDFLFGRYTATVAVNRGYDDLVDEMSYSFWVLPWKMVLVGFGSLFIVLFIIRAFFRTFEFKRKK